MDKRTKIKELVSVMKDNDLLRVNTLIDSIKQNQEQIPKKAEQTKGIKVQIKKLKSNVTQRYKSVQQNEELISKSMREKVIDRIN